MRRTVALTAALALTVVPVSSATAKALPRCASWIDDAADGGPVKGTTNDEGLDIRKVVVAANSRHLTVGITVQKLADVPVAGDEFEFTFQLSRTLLTVYARRTRAGIATGADPIAGARSGGGDVGSDGVSAKVDRAGNLVTITADLGRLRFLARTGPWNTTATRVDAATARVLNEFGPQYHPPRDRVSWDSAAGPAKIALVPCR